MGEQPVSVFPHRITKGSVRLAETFQISIELPEGLSIRLSKELSKGLSETAANIYKMIYADNYITRSDIANRIGISVTAVQKHINKLKSLRYIDRDGSTGHGSWIVIE